MTTTIAVPELRRYAPDALRMLGIPPGQADETADLLTWTEATGGHALEFVRRNRARLLWAPRPRARIVGDRTDALVVDARGASLLEFGVRLADLVCAETLCPKPRAVQVVSVWGTPFAAYLCAFAAERGVEVSAEWAPDPDGLDRPRELSLRGRSTAPRPVNDDPAYRASVAQGIPLIDEDFAEITQLFEMLRVPTSERSRLHAG